MKPIISKNLPPVGINSDHPVFIGSDSVPNTVWVNSKRQFGYLTGVGHSAGCPGITFRMSRGTLEKKEAIHTNDGIITLIAKGYNGVDWSIVGGINLAVDPSGILDEKNMPGCFRVMVKSSGDEQKWLKFDHTGTLHSNKFCLTESFSNVEERDRLIPFPIKGLIILVDDNGSGEPSFQGYTGKKWVNFN
jgi:hypothetical protein